MADYEDDKVPTWSVRDLGNYYGGLDIRRAPDGEGWQWCIENWDGRAWDSVPADVVAALFRWNREGGDRDTPVVDPLTAAERAAVEHLRTARPRTSGVHDLLAIIDRLAPRAEGEEGR